MNQEGLSSPKYGRVKGKRGRKSLKELREVDGLSKEQQKIDQLLNNGKGKCLPKDSWRSLHWTLGALMPLEKKVTKRKS